MEINPLLESDFIAKSVENAPWSLNKTFTKKKKKRESALLWRIHKLQISTDEQFQALHLLHIYI